MKSIYKQFLLLAGFYFIISLFVSYFENEVLELLNIGLLIIFLIILIVLILKKSFYFLEKFQNKFIKGSNYLYALGFIKYLQLIFLIPLSELDNYHTSLAQYNGTEYTSPYTDFLILITICIFFIFVVAILWATYASFIKPYVNLKRRKLSH